MVILSTSMRAIIESKDEEEILSLVGNQICLSQAESVLEISLKIEKSKIRGKEEN